MQLMKYVLFWLGTFYCLGKAKAQPIEWYSSNDIYAKLQKLNVVGSVLYIAAHPDDENNTLLPFLAKEKHYRTAYLSLTRGDGGQNLIGSEQGIELGLIRTQELLAARKIDGSEQYFTRAYEFGYSKTADETLRIWDKEKILSDVVWVIRKFQPDIIINRFPPDSRAGHGHHAASAILGAEAFTAAADPNRFPEQFAFGVKPWQAKRIFWNTCNFGSVNTTAANQLKMEVGQTNYLLGKSYGEIGAEARTMHKSQGEGRPRRRGSLTEYFSLVNGEPANNHIMDGVNTNWQRFTNGEMVANQINALMQQFSFSQPYLLVPGLVNVYKTIQALPEQNEWTKLKLQETKELIIACSGLFAEATTSQEKLVPGEKFPVTFYVTNRNGLNIQISHVQLPGMDTVMQKKIAQQEQWLWQKNVMVPQNQPISQPYWLVENPEKGNFVVNDQKMIGKAENDPVFTASFSFVIENTVFSYELPILYKNVDLVRGELYQPLVVVPATEAKFTEDNYVSKNGKVIETQLEVHYNTNISFAFKPGWQFTNTWMAKDSTQVQTVTDNNLLVKQVWLPLNSTTNNSSSLKSNSYVHTKQIIYNHIPNITYFPSAKTNLINLQVKTKGKKIGYLPGAGDKLPEALKQLGYQVDILNKEDLLLEKLQQYDAVITGIRAHNMHEYLQQKYAVLMQYIKEGGNLIVQYIRANSFNNQPIKVGPYPFTVSSGSRVTEEDAPVQFLLPNHPALQYPNKITSADFEGWVQERSTYQVEKADSNYVMPLAMNDTGEKSSNGSLLIGKYGKGNFVYASLVFFRQLPAGVPGAYRLLANLIALPKNTN